MKTLDKFYKSQKNPCVPEFLCDMGGEGHLFCLSIHSNIKDAEKVICVRNFTILTLNWPVESSNSSW